MKKTMFIIGLTFITVFYLSGSLALAKPKPRPEPTGEPQVIEVIKLTQAPVLDGAASDWSSVPGNKIKVSPAFIGDDKARYGEGEVMLKVGYLGDNVYFLVQWKDSTLNNTHKNFVWDETQGRYRAGKDREDRFIFKFFMSGKYATSMLAGLPSVYDVWHWKAYRSNLAGLAHDKSHIISDTKIAKSKKYIAQTGKEMWISRPSDKGDSLYQSKRYTDKVKDVMPKYIVNPSATGSIADVKAKGVWKDSLWTLEITRKLDTGDHDRDVVFKPGASVKGAVAVFDGVGDWHHSVSDTLLFKFQ